MAIVQGERASRREFMAARLMQRAFQHIGATLRPILLASGNSEETVDLWIREQEAEVRTMRAKLYFKVSNKPKHSRCTEVLMYISGTVDLHLGRKEKGLMISSQQNNEEAPCAL